MLINVYIFEEAGLFQLVLVVRRVLNLKVGHIFGVSKNGNETFAPLYTVGGVGGLLFRTRSAVLIKRDVVFDCDGC